MVLSLFTMFYFPIAMSVMRHRLVMNFQAEAEGMGADKLVQQVLEQQKSA